MLGDIPWTSMISRESIDFITELIDTKHIKQSSVSFSMANFTGHGSKHSLDVKNLFSECYLNFKYTKELASSNTAQTNNGWVARTAVYFVQVQKQSEKP